MTAGAPPPILEAVDVGYCYPGGTPTQALEGLSLEIADGEFVALLGPVGCGKTTLLRIFAGFLQPAKGRVRCSGASIDGPGWQRGYVLQEEAIFPWMTVRQNVEFGLLAKGLEPDDRGKVSDELLELIGLTAFADAYPRELSTGMSKMVEVVRVLATDPSILLLDEPFGALDAQTRQRMQDALAQLWAQAVVGSGPCGPCKPVASQIRRLRARNSPEKRVSNDRGRGMSTTRVAFTRPGRGERTSTRSAR